MNYVIWGSTKKPRMEPSPVLKVNNDSRVRCKGTTNEGKRCKQYRGINPANGLCCAHDPLDRTGLCKKRKSRSHEHMGIPPMHDEKPKHSTPPQLSSRWVYITPEPRKCPRSRSTMIESNPHWGSYDYKPLPRATRGGKVIPPLYPGERPEAPPRCAISFITHLENEPHVDCMLKYAD